MLSLSLFELFSDVVNFRPLNLPDKVGHKPKFIMEQLSQFVPHHAVV
jgi:hypothetical protein